MEGRVAPSLRLCARADRKEGEPQQPLVLERLQELKCREGAGLAQ